ncbi:MAG: riboflavin synthase [Bdellovibrionales bacterium]
MFSGIVETTTRVRGAQNSAGILRISLDRPPGFTDLHSGDSVAVDGICLTLEDFDSVQMTFALGPETLRITGWGPEGVLNKVVNLERSLRLQDRVHGHFVTGHVDAKGRILNVTEEGEALRLQIDIPGVLRDFIWPKGSVAVNGVSLTVNNVGAQSFQVGLIPETLKRTNLGALEVGDHVNLEVDNMARGLIHWARLQEKEKTNEPESDS